MKKLVILLLTGSLLACNTENGSEKNKTINTPEEVHHEKAANIDGLLLNNGAKWIADSITNLNVKSILGIIEKFNIGTDKYLPAYIAVSGDLQQGLNKMISECKMQGEDHEALHKWLEPLIAQVSKLKVATTTANADTLFEAIHTRVKLYSQYFQ